MTRRKRYWRFQIARKVADVRLRALPHVVGTCFGFKVIGGKRSEDLCVTVFVRRKVACKRLDKRAHVPKAVRRHGVELPTDVVEIRGIRRQAGFAIHAGGQQGTLDAWGVNGQASYGLTCAHCLPQFGQIVTGEFPLPGNYLALGTADTTIETKGAGVFPDYGDIDVGCVQLITPAVRAYANARPPQAVLRPPDLPDPSQLRALLQFLPVHGWGAALGRSIRGRVAGVFVEAFSQRFDLMIEGSNGEGLTLAGDSGLIWLTPTGQALAIHQAGSVEAGGGASRQAFGSFAFRIEDAFGITLRQG